MTSLEFQLNSARRSLARQANRLKKRKKLKAVSSVTVDPATMLLRMALEQPAIEHAIRLVRAESTDEDLIESRFAVLKSCHRVLSDQSDDSPSSVDSERVAAFQTAAQAFYNAAADFVEASRTKARSFKKLQHSVSLYSAVQSTVDDDEYFDAVDAAAESHVKKCSSASSPRPARRRTVPPRREKTVNFLSAMKSCIGKDLSKISMPVDFNEPLSALQRQTEDLEYSYLLDEAASEHDISRKLALVGVFALSGYSTIAIRAGKPFNPLLGETFDFDRRSDFGWRVCAEQVSHHPPTCALSAESVRGWHLRQSYTYVTKLKGRSLCVIPVGATYVTFEGSEGNDEVFVFEKATTATKMTNVLTGALQTDNFGEVVVRSAKVNSEAKCVLKFHETGYFSKNEPRKVIGTVTDDEGGVVYQIDATWDRKAMLLRLDEHENICKEELIWVVNPLPENADKMHNFTRFAIELNELEPRLPPSDSRLRPDQRLMEEGNWELSNEIKRRLEDLQRARRQQKEALNEEHTPVWFRRKPEADMIDANDVYDFDASYWLCRQSGDFSRFPDIFGLADSPVGAPNVPNAPTDETDGPSP